MIHKKRTEKEEKSDTAMRTGVIQRSKYLGKSWILIRRKLIFNTMNVFLSFLQAFEFDLHFCHCAPTLYFVRCGTTNWRETVGAKTSSKSGTEKKLYQDNIWPLGWGFGSIVNKTFCYHSDSFLGVQTPFLCGLFWRENAREKLLINYVKIC